MPTKTITDNDQLKLTRLRPRPKRGHSNASDSLSDRAQEAG
jgi:hypothetical protein